MEGLQLKHAGGRVEALAPNLRREFGISSATWFYIAVIMFCFFGLIICFSCKKFRHRLLGLHVQPDSSERADAVSEMSSSEACPEDVDRPPSPGLQSARRQTRVDRNVTFEMIELPQVPTNPPPTPESYFLE